MSKALVLLVFLIFQSYCPIFNALVQRYVASVGEDEVSYSQLIILPPRGRNSMLSIVSEDLDCYLLVGIDRIPTVLDNIYVVRFRKVVMLKLLPEDGFGRLFLGVWGGAKVNSFRFFAGTPVKSSAVISLSLGAGVTTFSICDAGLLTKDTQNSLLTIPINNPTMKHLCISNKIERLQFFVSGLNSTSVYDIIFQFYFSEPSTQADLYYSTILTVNSVNSINSFIPLPSNVSLVVDYPLPGTWTLLTSVYFKIDNGNILPENTSISSFVNIQYKSSPIPSQSISSMDIMQYSYDQYVITSPIILTSSNQSKLFLEIDLTHERTLMDLLYVAFQVQFKATTTSVTNVADNFAYRLTARAGNLPFNDNSSDIILHSNDSKIERRIQRINSSHHSSSAQQAQITIFTWTVLKPRIRYLGSATEVASLFWRINRLHDDDSVEESVQLKIVVTPCPPHTCAHGTCLVREGNIITSSCRCRYPYAGERCDAMAISMPFYTVQVVLLVISNFAMLPAVLLSFHHELYVIVVGLITASVSSGVYHLCDMDAICLVNLSFESLHVLDVLFTSGMISMLILYYAPIPPLIHASWSLLTLAILIPPTVNDPTNGAVIAVVIAISIMIVLLIWLVWYYRHCRSRQSKVDQDGDRDRQKQCWPNTASTSINYAKVPRNDDEAADLEMTLTPVAVNAQQEVKQQTDDSENHKRHDKHEEQHNNQQQQQNWHLQKQRAMVSRPNPMIVKILYYSSDSFLSIFLVIIGLVIFANEGRLDYWYLHSIWHVLMMTAAYFAIRGRFTLFRQFALEKKEAWLWYS